MVQWRRLLLLTIVLMPLLHSNVVTYKENDRFYLQSKFSAKQIHALNTWLENGQLDYRKHGKKITVEKYLNTTRYDLGEALGAYLRNNLIYESSQASESFNCHGFVRDHVTRQSNLKYVSSSEIQFLLENKCESHPQEEGAQFGVIVSDDQFIHSFVVIGEGLYLHKEGADFEDHIGFVDRAELAKAKQLRTDEYKYFRCP